MPETVLDMKNKRYAVSVRLKALAEKDAGSDLIAAPHLSGRKHLDVLAGSNCKHLPLDTGY